MLLLKMSIPAAIALPQEKKTGMLGALKGTF
jgi:hypothetical protein